MTRNRWLPVVAGFVVGVVLALALLLPRGQVTGADPKQAPQPAIGRYQFYLKEGTARYLHDTATGKVWYFGGKDKWLPAIEAPK